MREVRSKDSFDRSRNLLMCQNSMNKHAVVQRKDHSKSALTILRESTTASSQPIQPFAQRQLGFARDFSGLGYRHGTEHSRPGVLPWRAAHNATEGLTESALGFVAK